MISLQLDERSEKLRNEFATWLRSNPPPVTSERIELDEFVRISSDWQRKLAGERWIAVHWPERFGGRGLSLVEEAIIQEQLAEKRAPQLVNLFGLTMVGPVLIKHGTDAQRSRYLPKILTAEEIWCQGFSEPEAGSDLASLRTTALRAGSVWRITGQKIWTSFAQYAKQCFLLARSALDVPKHEGLSYFLVPMDRPGIEVRPLTQISGDREFNELFLENVEVSDDHLVGKAGDGWKIAISTLMYERVILTFARHLQSEIALDDIRSLVSKANDPSILARFGQLIGKCMAVRAMALSHLIQYTGDVFPGPEGSLDKLAWSETFQQICQFALELQGVDSVFTGGPFALGDGLHQHRYLYSRGRTIAAGTSEIQRNIIAERVLGLPKGS